MSRPPDSSELWRSGTVHTYSRDLDLWTVRPWRVGLRPGESLRGRAQRIADAVGQPVRIELDLGEGRSGRVDPKARARHLHNAADGLLRALGIVDPDGSRHGAL